MTNLRANLRARVLSFVQNLHIEHEAAWLLVIDYHARLYKAEKNDILILHMTDTRGAPFNASEHGSYSERPFFVVFVGILRSLKDVHSMSPVSVITDFSVSSFSVSETTPASICISPSLVFRLYQRI